MLVVVDADSCKVSAREILLRRARRGDIELLFVANNSNKVPKNESGVQSIVTDKTPESADNTIIDITGKTPSTCLVVTCDIVLADKLVKRKIAVMNDIGTRFDENNIGERLSERNFSLAMREARLWEPKRTRISKDAFANALDRFLHIHL